MSKRFGLYLAFAYQLTVSLYFIFSNLWSIYFTRLSLEHQMAVISPNLLDLTVSVFIPLAVLIGTILYILTFERKNQIASRVAFSMIGVNILGALAFAVQILGLVSQGSWGVLNIFSVILISPLYVIPAFIWAYLLVKASK